MNDNCKPPAPGAGRAFGPATALHTRWKFSVLAAALAACAGSYAPDALALVLGPVTVQSALGEPLRAEIDLPQITPAEAESLRAGTAGADVFRQQGMEYTATVSQMRVQLYRRPDGRTVLRLTGNSPVNEPFVDLVIDARWGAGQVTRSYTLLFDPPAAQRAAPAAAAAVAPTLAAPTDSRPTASAPRRPITASAPASASAPDTVDGAAAPARPARPSPVPRSRPDAQDTAPGAVQVRPGDTAGRIANARRPQGVSLDQMLLALSRANPDAFVQGNVNRLKAGSVLQIPDREQALATPATQARQTIAVQSRDFNAFRRRLASAAPSAEQGQPQRSASGSVQTQTQDASAPVAAPDKLTLSKGAMQGTKTTEEMLAQRKQGNEAAARTQELAKNIEELNRLSAASGAPATAASAGASTGAAPPAPATAPAPALAVPNPGLTLPAEPAGTPAAESPAAADTASASGPEAPTAAAPASSDTATTPPAPDAAPTPATPATPAPSALPQAQPEPAIFVQDLLDQPALPLAGAALLLLLAYAAYRSAQKRRRNKSMADSGFLDSRAPSDSFFGASGGQRVDTTSTNSTLGAMSQAYSHSQLDTGGEVDPVAEADVYLAYGRDLQAEEILREAARQNPARVPVFLKLAEIYAKRLDRKALEAVAADVHRLTQGQGAEWEQIVNLGRTLEPDNALYQPGGAPAAGAAGLAAAGLAGMGAARPGAASVTTQFPSRPMDLDLSLDFDLPDDALTEVPGDLRPGSSAPVAPPDLEPAKAPAQAQDWDELEDLVAFNAAIASPPPAAATQPPPQPAIAGAADAPSAPAPLADADTGLEPPSADAPTLESPEDGNNLEWEELPVPAAMAAAAEETQAQAVPPADDGMDLDLDMNLDTDTDTDMATPAPLPAPTDLAASNNDALDNFAMHLELPPLDSSPQDSRTPSSLQAPPAEPAAPAAPAFVPTDSGLMDFDFNDLSLDFDLPGTPPAGDSGANAAPAGADPADMDMDLPADLDDHPGAEDALATKLALAQEFHAIGDSEGARTLVEEVIAEASGSLKARARQLLAGMD